MQVRVQARLEIYMYGEVSSLSRKKGFKPGLKFMEKFLLFLEKNSEDILAEFQIFLYILCILTSPSA